MYIDSLANTLYYVIDIEIWAAHLFYQKTDVMWAHNYFHETPILFCLVYVELALVHLLFNHTSISVIHRFLSKHTIFWHKYIDFEICMGISYVGSPIFLETPILI